MTAVHHPEMAFLSSKTAGVSNIGLFRDPTCVLAWGGVLDPRFLSAAPLVEQYVRAPPDVDTPPPSQIPVGRASDLEQNVRAPPVQDMKSPGTSV